MIVGLILYSSMELCFSICLQEVVVLSPMVVMQMIISHILKVERILTLKDGIWGFIIRTGGWGCTIMVIYLMYDVF